MKLIILYTYFVTVNRFTDNRRGIQRVEIENIPCATNNFTYRKMHNIAVRVPAFSVL